MRLVPKQVFRILKGEGKERSSAMNRIANFLSRLPKDRDFKVEISEQKPRRTNSQNALMWALYGDILERGGPDMAGWDKDDLHRFFCIEHFGSEVKTVFGRSRHVPVRTTSGLNKQEMSDYIDHMVRFMAEHGVVLKLPGDA